MPIPFILKTNIVIYNKTVVLIFLLHFFVQNQKNNLYNILIDSEWKVHSIETINLESETDIHPKISLDTSSVFRGQVITFNNDHTCELKNDGQGLWSNVRTFKWRLESDNSLIFQSKQGLNGMNSNCHTTRK